MIKSLGTRIRPIGCVAGVALLFALLSISSPSITVRASTFTVTNCSGSDSVPNSLPSLVEIAGDGDVISFGVSCTGATRILLDDTMTIEADMTIRASGIAVVVDGRADPVTHAGGDMIFEITDVVTDATISGLTIQNGHGECAGAICNDGVLTVTNCTIVNNFGDEAGAIQNTDTLVVTNSTITGNSASTTGVGGILNDEADVTVTNSTIVGNSGGISGGIGSTDTEGAEALADTIIASNSGGNGNCSRAVENDGHNLQFGDSSCGATIPQQNPLLAPLGDYGGITPTMALLPGSPAIDTGDDTICVNPDPGGVNSRDQRAIARPQGMHCDIGAFESRGFILSISGGNNQSTRVGTAFAQPLAVTVSARDSGVPVQGGQITFTPPASGASAVLSTLTATITGTSASVNATANIVDGQYQVPASTAGATPVSFTLTNTPSPITLSPVTLPHGKQGQAYSQPITASGGTAPYSFTVMDGALPAGITLRSDGLLAGTPSVHGSFSFTAMATDSTHVSGFRAYTLVIDAPTLVSINVSANSVSLKVGEVVQLKATGTYSDGSTQDISGSVVWSSTDATIASVDATGQVQGRIPGNVTVTAASGGVTGNATVTVLPLYLKAIPAPPARPSGAAAASSNPSAQPPPRP